MIVFSVAASTPTKGSSIRYSCASCAKALAKNTRCCWPPDNCAICRLDIVSMPILRRHAKAFSLSAFLGRRKRPSCAYRPITTTSSTEAGKSQSTDSF
mmetsp:Transcript_19005/g.44270  ORF Transcript_19005/g.44270 Transcript_19005/m.44270 type:complete len:98 (+) Transcript_19005:666-959(+)